MAHIHIHIRTHTHTPTCTRFTCTRTVRTSCHGVSKVGSDLFLVAAAVPPRGRGRHGGGGGGVGPGHGSATTGNLLQVHVTIGREEPLGGSGSHCGGCCISGSGLLLLLVSVCQQGKAVVAGLTGDGGLPQRTLPLLLLLLLLGSGRGGGGRGGGVDRGSSCCGCSVGCGVGSGGIGCCLEDVPLDAASVDRGERGRELVVLEGGGEGYGVVALGDEHLLVGALLADLELFPAAVRCHRQTVPSSPSPSPSPSPSSCLLLLMGGRVDDIRAVLFVLDGL